MLNLQNLMKEANSSLLNFSSRCTNDIDKAGTPRVRTAKRKLEAARDAYRFWKESDDIDEARSKKKKVQDLEDELEQIYDDANDD